jgi:hypothetical protein
MLRRRWAADMEAFTFTCEWITDNGAIIFLPVQGPEVCKLIIDELAFFGCWVLLSNLLSDTVSAFALQFCCCSIL